ncbi:uncharacterized protein Tco025E_05719 [Trypanosoma conorhini]|uniref:Uncharacterized protein n=1 Tax=Trypanosoma conorhini TaxID=83891 RepID=A0A422PAL9_9TRYP|nr:uncharacterized protein Tco025E_05719 [Trypanosoma conorhini]RNF14759.1 hypothetical protein Tco025E_05719 [Trypanosoma conorhini]
MWCAALEFVLWLVVSVKPIVMGAQLCRSAREGRLVDTALVTNLTLAMVLLWLLEVLDALVLAYIFSMRALYVCSRIILSLYLLHPRFRGATRVYRRFLAVPVARYAPLVDDLVAQHLLELERSGGFCYLSTAWRSLMLAARFLLDFMNQLIFPSKPALFSPQPEYSPGAVAAPAASPELTDIFSF